MADNNVTYSMSLQDQVTPQIQKAEGAVLHFEGALESLKGLALSAFAGWGIKEVVGNIIDAGTQVENAKIGLTTMLGSAADAQNVINQTMQDAAATPFDFSGLLKANQLLIGAQVPADRARQAILDLANAVAATGGSNDELNRMAANLTQIKNVGQASSVDIKQFAFANINIYKLLADQMGITTVQLKKKLEDGLLITYNDITKALHSAHEAGGIYAGGLEAMGNATSTQLSSVGDAVFTLSNQIFQDLKPAIDSIIVSVKDFVTGLGNLWQWMKENKQTFKDIGETILIVAGIMAGYQLALGAIALWEGIVMIATGGLTMAMYQLGIAMLSNPIGWIIGGLTVLVGAVVYCYNHFQTFRGIIWGVWEFLKAWVNWIVVVPIKVLYELAMAVANVFNPSEMLKHLNAAKEVVFNGAKELGTSFGRGFDEGVKNFQQEQNDKAPDVVKNGLKDPFAGFRAADRNKAKPVGAGADEAATQQTKASKVAGQKVLNINITIGSLVHDFKVVTTNIKEAPERVKEMMTKVLTDVINDSQVVAGT